MATQLTLQNDDNLGEDEEDGGHVEGRLAKPKIIFEPGSSSAPHDRSVKQKNKLLVAVTLYREYSFTL